VAEKKLTVRVDAETAGLSRGMKQASAQVNTFGSSIQKGITRHAAGIRKTGMALAGLGMAMTGMAMVSIKAAVDFEKELANVSTMLDDVSMKFMPAYAEGLRNMAKEFGQSTKTLSKGLYDILSASIPPAKALDVLAVSAKAAVAGLTETGITADAITTILNSYGFAAEDAGEVSDKLWAIIKKGKTTMIELAPSIGKVASIASTAGLNFNELGATLATLTRGGIKTDEAMTGVRAVMLAFLKPTDDAAKAAKEFGLELNSNTLRTKGLRGVIELLNNASAEQLARILPNVRGLAAMATALGDAAGWAESYEAMINSAGLTEEMFQKQTGALAFTFDQLKQEVTDAFRVIGTELLPIIKTELVPIIRDVIEHMKVWIGRFKELSPGVKKFLLVLGPLLIALGGFLMILPALATAIGVLSGPIGWIVLAITGLTAAFVYFYTTNEKFRNVINAIGKEIKGAFQDWYTLGVNIKNWVIWFAKNFVKYWVAVWEGSVAAVKNGVENIKIIFDWLSEFIRGWGIWFGKNFLNVWKNLFSAIQTGLATFGKNMVAQFTWIWEKIKHPLKKIPRPDWTPLFEDFEAKWEELPKFTELKMKAMAEGVRVQWEPMPGWVTPPFDAIKKGSGEGGAALDKLNKKLGDTNKETKELSKNLRDASKWLLAVGLSGKKIPLTTITDWAEKYQKRLNDELEKTNHWLVAIKSSAKPLPGTGITDWYKVYQKRLNDELEKTNHWLIAIKSSAKALPGTGITDWYAKYQEYLNDKLEKTNHWLVAIASGTKKLPGTGITDWYEKYQQALNDELEKTDHWLVAISSSAKKLPGTSITDWYEKYQKLLNDELEKTNHWLVAINSSAKKLPGTNITDWYSKYQKFLNDELEKTNKWLIVINSSAKKLPGTGITDWYSKYQALLNDELEKTNKWLVVIKSSAKKLPGSTITDWAEKDQKLINDELEKTKRLLDVVGKSTAKLPGATITDWAQKYQAQLNHELEMSRKYLEGIGLAAGRLPVKTISDWAKYQALANAELSKTQEILIALGLATADFSKEQLAMTNFFNWLSQKIRTEKQEWAKSWLEYFSEVHDMHFRSAEDFEKWWNERSQSEKGHLDESKADWEGHVADLERIWEGFTSSVNRSMSDMFYDMMMGTADFEDAWQAFCNSIKQAFVRAVADMLVEKLGLDKIFSGNILEWGNLFTGLGTLIASVFKGVGSAVWGVLTGIGDAAWAAGSAISGAFTGAGASVAAFAGQLALMWGVWELGTAIIDSVNKEWTEFYGTVEEARVVLEHLGELTGGIAVGAKEFLQDLIYYGEKYGETMEGAAHMIWDRWGKVIKWLGISEKEFYKKLEKAAKAAGITWGKVSKDMVKTTEEATEDMVKTTEEATEDMANSYNDLTEEMTKEMSRMKKEGRTSAEDIRNFMATAADGMVQIFGQSTQSAIDSLKRIPTRIDFDVIGSLDMPSIPTVGDQSFNLFGNVHMPAVPQVPDQWFNIFGNFQMPEMPSFQHGGLIEPGELVLSRPITSWLRKALSSPGPMSHTPSTANPSSNPGQNIIVNVPRGAFIVYGDIRTKADVEELISGAGRGVAEDIARRLAEP